MKKITLLILLSLFLPLFLSACTTEWEDDDGQIDILCTVFPAYDWARELTAGAEHTRVSLLLDSGEDMHSYQPTADDMIKISTCDILIHVGGESDAWVEDSLREARNPNMTVISMLDIPDITLYQDNMADHIHEHNLDDSDHDDDHSQLYDEHVWLSLRNAKTVCRRITEVLCQKDGDSRDIYTANLTSYEAALNALDVEYQSTVDSAARKMLVFCDRFPFRYMTEDYGLSYAAAFAGCSSDTNASFETVISLANTIDSNKLSCVIVLEGSDQRLAQQIIDHTSSHDADILVLDSIQSVPAAKIVAGTTYLSIMSTNLTVLKQALN